MMNFGLPPSNGLTYAAFECGSEEVTGIQHFKQTGSPDLSQCVQSGTLSSGAPFGTMH